MGQRKIFRSIGPRKLTIAADAATMQLDQLIERIVFFDVFVLRMIMTRS